ncbi:MAG: efflux RND transporter periplasmic adaptor subunit [Treponema sp.]|nr:efflux RND transporter periplasmic adaptor subunit [Treponema sp.]
MKHTKTIQPKPLVLPLLALGAALLAGCGGRANTPVYEFTSVSRGTLERTVSATGTLHPVAIVRILPRMSGKVETIYTDFNAPVQRGQVLAVLNTDMLRLRREQQMANVIKARANYELQRLTFQSQQVLASRNLISEFEFLHARTNMEILRADLAAAEASLRSIETEINQHAFITSPIDGIVLERNINEGDTVVDSSSGNSSFMFVLAENLEEMRIESWVGELDIASIREGQDVRFTLESLPGRTFTGSVESRRLMPSIQDNVVSYKVIISVSNHDGSLLPGMTCSVEFIQERSENILVVPNAALRYQPTFLSPDEIDEIIFAAGLRGMGETEKALAVQRRDDARQAAASSGPASTAPQGGVLAGLMMPAGARMTRMPATAAGQQRAQIRGSGGASPPRPLWFIDSSGRPDVILVHTGLSDGWRTEIQPVQGGAEDIEGKRIILRERVRL